jgi:hypothetical protein
MLLLLLLCRETVLRADVCILPYTTKEIKKLRSLQLALVCAALTGCNAPRPCFLGTPFQFTRPHRSYGCALQIKCPRSAQRLVFCLFGLDT